jgi:hypothetical protein
VITDMLRACIPAKARPYGLLQSLVVRATRQAVMSGPFMGMRYVPAAANSALAPKLLGRYEYELIPWINRLLLLPITHLIDIGCAEGYYAVGAALKRSDLSLVAFDTDPVARELCARLAGKNGVAERVSSLGTCTPDLLEDAMKGRRAAVICDVEGHEDELLDPEIVPSLRSSPTLVEVHEHLRTGVGGRLIDRFQATHQITRVDARPRTRRDCPPFHPLLHVFPRETVAALLTERPDSATMYWLYMEPKPGYVDSLKS